MIKALATFHGDIARVTLEQVQDIFFGVVPRAKAFVAKIDGETVGYTGVTQTIVIHDGAPRVDIHHLFIDETHRAKGIGTALIEAAKTYALSIDATRLTIGTDPSNATAIAAYRAMPRLKERTVSGPWFGISLTD